jgi:hypothetical protein
MTLIYIHDPNPNLFFLIIIPSLVSLQSFKLNSTTFTPIRVRVGVRIRIRVIMVRLRVREVNAIA